MRYHFIGIGGVGMSAIAQILHERGETVSGSDRLESDTTTRLRAMGVRVFIGHSQKRQRRRGGGLHPRRARGQS